MTDAILDRAREILTAAEKATPGPWDDIYGEVVEVRDADGSRIAILTNLIGRHGERGRRDMREVEANAAYIVAADPKVGAAICTALIARTERMHRLEDALREQCLVRQSDGSWYCKECGIGGWRGAQPERHAPDCLAALQEDGK